MVNMKEKKDLRIIKTQMNLYSALTNLLKTKSFENIKVSDICSEALVNRSTFYDHYNDKYELLVDYINSEKKALEDALSINKKNFSTKKYYIELIKIVLDHVEELKDLYHAIIINNQNSIIMNILIDVITKDVEDKVNDNKNTSEVPSKIITKFYVGAVVNVCIEWLMNNNSYKKEDIIKYLTILLPDNIDKL